MHRRVSIEQTPVNLCWVSCLIRRKIMCLVGSCLELYSCTRFILGVMELNCHFTLRVGRMYLSLKSLSFSCTAGVQEYILEHTSSLKFQLLSVFFGKFHEWSPSFIHLRGTGWKGLDNSVFKWWMKMAFSFGGQLTSKAKNEWWASSFQILSKMQIS